MKRNLYLGMVLVLFSIFVVGAQAFGAPALLDDFSGTYIDSQKWSHREFVREVAAGKLVSKIGNASAGYFRNRTPITDPASINAIGCKITVVETVLDSGGSFARIDGFFYNTKSSGGATGDIWAAVIIGDRGSGLEAYWEVYEALSDDLNNMVEKGSDTLIGPGTLVKGTAYTVKIEYDGNKQFIFTVKADNVSYISGLPGPDRERAAVTLFKGLTTGIDADGGSGTGYASASFDDVYINNDPTVYDDFSTAPLDQTKWQGLQFVREISGGKLRLNLQADGERRDATLSPTDQTVALLKAKVLVESGSWVSSGARGIARIAGEYYNDSRGPDSGQGYNGKEGDVWVDNRITLDDAGNLKARCFLSRNDTPDPWGPSTSLFYQEFNTPIAFNTYYTLSIEYTGSELIFRCNNETYQYTIKTPKYEPSEGQHRQLKSRVYADPGEWGYIKANFDDVYTGCPDQPTYDGSGTWNYSENDNWANCPGETPDPDETGTLTITQNGNSFTLVVDGEETFTGTICGETYTYIDTYPEESPSGDPGTVTVTVTVTLSSSTTGSGSYNGTWLADDGSFSCSNGAFFSLTKQAAAPPADGGGGGGGCFIDTAAH